MTRVRLTRYGKVTAIGLRCSQQFALRDPRSHPSSTRRRINQSLASELPCQARLQAFAESRRHIKHAAVADQANNIASPIQNGNAVFAHTKMLFHPLADRGLYGLIDVVRQFPPNLNAADVYGDHVTRVSLLSSSRLRCSMRRRVRAPVHRVPSILPEAVVSLPRPG